MIQLYRSEQITQNPFSQNVIIVAEDYFIISSNK